MIRDHHSLYPETAFRKSFNVGGRPATLESGGGGGGGGVQEQYISTAPKQFLPYVERALGKAEALTETPYQAYGGERMAGATEAQQAARSETAGLTTPGQFTGGTGFIGAGGLGALEGGQYGAGQFTPGQVTSGLGSFAAPGAASQYMSPYMQQVTDVQKQAAVREAQIAQQQANLGAARQGTYGGARQAIAQAERERGLLDRLSNIQATGSQAAFDQAMKAFEAEQGRGLQAGLQTQQQQLEAQRLGEQSRQFGAGLGMQGAQTAIQAGQALGQIGTQQQAADLARLQAQEQAGGRTQAESQQQLDIAYQDFLAQQRAPYEQLEFMRSMVSGTPMGQAQTMYQAPQSTTQNLMQLGLGGLGLYGAYGGFR